MNNHQYNWLYAIILFIVLSIFLQIFEKFDIHKAKYPKGKLIQQYGVDKKTFRKWIIHFGQEVFPDITVYDKMRKLNLITVMQLTYLFGAPNELPVLSKKQLVEIGEGTYMSLRHCISNNPEGFGINAKAYAATNKFPPLIGQNILDAYG